MHMCYQRHTAAITTLRSISTASARLMMRTQVFLLSLRRLFWLLIVLTSDDLIGEKKYITNPCFAQLLFTDCLHNRRILTRGFACKLCMKGV